jgi:hypothetical protein
MTLTNLGAALREAGRLGEAITACQDAATIRREVGGRQGDAMRWATSASRCDRQAGL